MFPYVYCGKSNSALPVRSICERKIKSVIGLFPALLKIKQYYLRNKAFSCNNQGI
jgi:hypothetical protein